MPKLTFEQQQRRRPQTQAERECCAKARHVYNLCINEIPDHEDLSEEEEAIADCNTCKDRSNFRFEEWTHNRHQEDGDAK